MIKVKFLGTASGSPVSGLFPASALIEKDGKKLLVDVGEGIQYQLFKSGEGLRGLQTIFITHMHGDHVLGLPGLLMTLSLLNWNGELRIYGPAGLKEFVTSVLQATGSGEGVLNRTSFFDFNQDFAVGEMRIKPFRVRHRIEANGLLVNEADKPGRFDEAAALSLGVPRGPLWGQLQRGKTVEVGGKVVRPEQVLGPTRRGASLVYTGDAAPSEEITRLARGVDCLIHDAAFRKEDEEEAHQFGHSTWYDAVRAAKEAGARRLILFNFGGRMISSLDDVLASAKREFPETYLATDLSEFYVASAAEIDKAD